MSDRQHIFFRLDPSSRPQWTFYSTPASVIGGGATLQEARTAAHAALRFALDTPDLPEICEYTEREAVPGAWVRVALDEQCIDRQGAFDVLQSAMRAAPTGTFDAYAATGDVIVVPCEPTDTVGFISDQMTRHDALWVALNAPTHIQWVAFHGPEADVENAAGASLGNRGFGYGSLLVDVMNAVGVGRHAMVCV